MYACNLVCELELAFSYLFCQKNPVKIARLFDFYPKIDICQFLVSDCEYCQKFRGAPYIITS